MTKRLKIGISLGGVLLMFLSSGIGSAAEKTAASPSDKIGYNQYVRPILSENCFFCHGPDKNRRKAKLRLDDRDAALTGGKSGDPAIVPGKPEQSALIERINSKADDELMPPADSHKTLSPPQKQILTKWIAQGATYEPHWAYIPPQRPVVPEVHNAAWIRNPIDAFVLHELEAHGIAPSKQADKRTLLRRLSLDLIGLPPSVDEMNAFLGDDDSKAYEKQVDRLLASPHYGERMAVPWLDAVRFADTVGFHGDQNQNVFPYRDYVINAFNHNKPFDQFTTEQIAGDLLPNPTTEQRVATCFNRLNMMTREGGAQAKEYLSKYAADRVRTLGTAFLGSTLACCECHDHKFDPFKAKDFYSLAAFWDDVKQWGIYTTYTYTPNPDLAGFTNDHPFPPEIVVDSPYLQERIARLRAQLHAETAKLKPGPAFEDWKRDTLAFLEKNPSGWTTPPVGADGVTEFATKPGSTDSIEVPLPVGRVAAVQIEVLPTAKNSVNRGRKTEAMVNVALSLKKGGQASKLAVFYADADRKEPIYVNGYASIGIKDNWRTAAATDSSPEHGVYILDSPITATQGDTLVVTLAKNTLAAVRVSISPVAPSVDHATDPEFGRSVKAALKNAEEAQRIFIASTAPDPVCRKVERQILDCRGGQSPVLTTVAVTPKVTRILPRGNWQDDSGPVVTPAVPEFLSHEKTDHRLTRLDLAKWLVSPENPLVARTFVNRLWKQYFGNGICTVDDLGSQGEWPSHPELLDWLAVEFESGWDIKHTVRLIVTSAAYRQDSNLRADLHDADPANRLLASQNPRRLEAEFVRDNALFAAGLLTLDIGGPSAKPYQPAGYYANIQFPSRDYVADTGDREYRRGLYMHWQRTFLHPMLANFDAPSREDSTCTRNVSNTPQQALTLLNDPTFVEAARALAASATSGGNDDERVNQIFQRALDRPVKPKEITSLKSFLAEQRAYYHDHPEDAAKLMRVGLSAEPTGADDAELAAWTSVCRVVLNLHEMVTRY